MTFLLCRLYVLRRHRLLKSFLYYFTFFLVTLTFLYDLLMLYDNEIHAYRYYGFDYLLTDFDEESLKMLSGREGVESLYPARLIGSSIRVGNADKTEEAGSSSDRYVPAGPPAEDFQIYLADSWDEEGLSFLSTKRRIAGSTGGLGEKSMVMDVLSARAVHASLGDCILVTIGDEELAFRLDMILEPEFVLNTGIAVCLYTQDLRAKWLSHFDEEPSYSVLFLKGTDPVLETWLYEDYAGPMSRGLGEAERKQINRACIIKKEWMLDDMVRNFLFTPPAVFTICAAAFFLAIFFIRREGTLRLQEEKDNLLILQRLGMDKKQGKRIYIALTGLCMSLGCILAAVTVKKGIYDRLIQTHYLSWKAVWMVAAILCLLCFVILVRVSWKFWDRIEPKRGR